MHNWKIGDVVRSKTGGPKMTVAEMPDGRVVCQWFVGATLHSSRFGPTSLLRAD